MDTTAPPAFARTPPPRSTRWRATALAALLLTGAGCTPDGLINQAPVASAGRDLRVVRDQDTVYARLDGRDSFDPDGDPLALRWSVVQSPAPVALSASLRRDPQPLVPLGADGLYVFELVVDDGLERSAPDFVNVWVGDDTRPADAGPPDAEDAAPAPDADRPPPDDAGAVAPDAQGDAAPPEPGEDHPPVPVFDVSADRLHLGQTVRLSAARSRDEGGPGALDFHWSLLSGPFRMGPRFEADGVGAAYLPRRPGRYTFRLTADDGVHQVSVERAIYVEAPRGWVLSIADGRIHQIDLDDGTPTGVIVDSGLAGELRGFAVRAGAFYLTTTAPGASRSVLSVLLPNQPIVQRPLPTDGGAGEPEPAVDGVWVPMRSAPMLYFTDPAGEAPLRGVALGGDATRPSHLSTRGPLAALTALDGTGRALALDLRSGVVTNRMMDAPEGCLPKGVLAEADWVYVACRNHNAILRTDWEGVRAPEIVGLPGDYSPRAERMVRVGRWLAVMHRETDYVSLVDVGRFDLPPDHPDRARGAQRVLAVEHAVVDIDARGDVLYALVVDRLGTTVLHAYAVESGRRLWRRPLPVLGGVAFRTDAADDFSRDLGAL